MQPSAAPDNNIFGVTFANGSLQVSAGSPLLLLTGLVLLILVVGFFWRSRGDRVVNINVVVPFTGGNISIARDRQVVRIAHQAWIEIVTRKVGQPFDAENDVVVEVFDSWYELFRELRSLAKSVPPEALGTRNSRKMTDILVEALNVGLRPTLTRWQARYRVWYSEAKSSRPSDSPQDIQRDFPQYVEMLADIQGVSAKMVKFGDLLHNIEKGVPKDGNTSAA